MREAAVSRRVPRSRRCAPLNAGPFAVSCNVRIPKGFPATCVRYAPSPCTQKGFPSEVCQAGERGRQRGFGLRGRDTRTGIMWAAVRNEYLLPLWAGFYCEDFPSTRLPLLKHSFGWKI